MLLVRFQIFKRIKFIRRRIFAHSLFYVGGGHGEACGTANATSSAAGQGEGSSANTNSEVNLEVREGGY